MARALDVLLPAALESASTLQPKTPSPAERGGALAADCDACGGRGWVIVADGGGGTARRCACQNAARPIAELLKASRMRPAEIAAALEPWDESLAPYPQSASLFARMKAKPETVSKAPWALVLLSAAGFDGDEPVKAGAPGRGKTKAAAIAMRTWCELTNRAGLWVNVPADLGDVMRDRLHDGSSELEAKIRRYPFVVFDDAGAERDTEARSSAFAEWTYHRHREQLPTIYTSNAASPDQLGDGRIASRLGEAEIRYLVGARDYRDLRAERAS